MSPRGRIALGRSRNVERYMLWHRAPAALLGGSEARHRYSTSTGPMHPDPASACLAGGGSKYLGDMRCQMADGSSRANPLWRGCIRASTRRLQWPREALMRGR